MAESDVRPPSLAPADPNRRVCYCFEHSAADLVADLRAHGVSTIRQSIKEACAAGRDDCGRKNPSGRCCLGDVGRVLKAARATAGEPSAELAVEPTCCGPTDET